MSKRIWYLHHYAGAPELGMSYRPYYLAKAFNKLGHTTFVIGSSFHHLQQYQRRQQDPIVHETIDDVDYLWLRTNQYRGNGLGRLLNMLGYSARLAMHADRLVKYSGTPDVIIVSSSHLFHYPVARRLARRYQAQLIFEVRDIWPLSLIELIPVSPYHPVVLLMAAIEKSAYRHSDKVVSLLSNAEPYMQSKGLAEGKFCYIPNGISDTDISMEAQPVLPVALQHEITALKQQGAFLLGYAGAHGPPNALPQLLDAIALLQSAQQQASPWHVLLVGNGGLKSALQAQAEERGLRHISFHAAVSKPQALCFLAQMDALFIGWQNQPIYQYGISPNKLFDYMLAKKPVIQAINTAAEPVQQSGCGIVVPAEAPRELAAAIKKMQHLAREEREKMGQKGYDYVLKHHDYQVLAQRYVELFYA